MADTTRFPDPAKQLDELKAILMALVQRQHGGLATIHLDSVFEAGQRYRMTMSKDEMGILTIRTADHEHHYVPVRVSNELWAGEPMYILRCESCQAPLNPEEGD